MREVESETGDVGVARKDVVREKGEVDSEAAGGGTGVLELMW